MESDYVYTHWSRYFELCAIGEGYYHMICV